MTSSPVVDNILSARYLRQGEHTFEDICRRVAHALADDKDEQDRFFEAMMSLRFLPNSPTLMNAGTGLGQLSACFTLPVPDSIDGIFEAMKQGAIIHKTGGGTGYNFSHIRPEGSPVRSTDGVASGPVSFMRVFNAATDVIKQGGRRRGANMGILNVWHPDILDFITAKKEEGDIANFNISVMVNDRFMNLVEQKAFELVWLTHPHSGKTVTVGEIWNGIVDGIWKNGEPGILFYDEINKRNPTPQLGDIDTTNPCGEQPLLPFESCVLGSINLDACIKDGILDETLLEETVRMAVRFLDTVIERNIYPIPQIAEATLKTRKIGLGVMGVHDALLRLGIAYDSPEGRSWCEQIMEKLTRTAVDESRILASSLGPFPAWDGSIWKEYQVRNAAMTTVAPTGTISLLAGCSSGIEPIFSFAYTRKNTVGKTFVIVNPVFKEALVQTLSHMHLTGDELIERTEEVISHVHKTGTIQDLSWLPGEFRTLFRTALDISWKDHILMQATFQKYVHASISKTVNMPSSATRDDCEEALLMAWKLDLKGITIYRTGSRETVVLALSGETDKSEPVPELKADDGRNLPEKIPSLNMTRPKELSGKTYICQSGCCRLYVTVNLLDGKPIEVFIRTVGIGGCDANSSALGRAISTGLQSGVPYQKFVRQFGKVNCVSAIKNSSSEGVSCADVVGRCIDLAAKHQSITTLEDWSILKTEEKRLCPECRQPLDFGEGCNQGICKHCGWSGCS
ncbi:MAG TPA: adenosylcobalamin-dependent ribonucleoside-diphosphate reductase [Methanospirillum sp.]|uniref:adenosylcobalamin-dependent ribonucleoside-diphosphate reductase n=1 Tax=Methanospirillum sp. TaxID=45200 RepID=UPI002BA3560A|nr:adenosylcobalamin-dependent ribonucleoside-diphosphate reductase [Methanospirillum sp.]HWQ63473.1 adenosylcobalamin-dependent ribonucleoside-diphosphate reductase [Methanospirillum sp.]